MMSLTEVYNRNVAACFEPQVYWVAEFIVVDNNVPWLWRIEAVGLVRQIKVCNSQQLSGLHYMATMWF